MAALTAILTALRRAAKREVDSFGSIKLNNFFLVSALLAYGSLASHMPIFAAAPFLTLMGFVVLFPLSSDPLSKVPASRLRLWPLNPRQHLALRLASLAFSPVLWLTVIVFIVADAASALFFVIGAIIVQLLVVLAKLSTRRRPSWNIQRVVPPFPGPLGGLLRSNLRQLITTLDFYVALLLCLAGTAYRLLAAHPEPDAFPIVAVLIGIALSTYAQCLFGLDSSAGLTRYRLLPLRGWQLLIAKDVVFLAVLCVFTAPIDFSAGLTFSLAALAIGHYPSLTEPATQQRWRFSSGVFKPGLLQLFVASGFAVAESRGQPQFMTIAAALYIVSLACGSWYWERKILAH